MLYSLKYWNHFVPSSSRDDLPVPSGVEGMKKGPFGKSFDSLRASSGQVALRQALRPAQGKLRAVSSSHLAPSVPAPSAVEGSTGDLMPVPSPSRERRDPSASPSTRSGQAQGKLPFDKLRVNGGRSLC